MWKIVERGTTHQTGQPLVAVEQRLEIHIAEDPYFPEFELLLFKSVF
jgi:hypothetical protein